MDNSQNVPYPLAEGLVGMTLFGATAQQQAEADAVIAEQQAANRAAREAAKGG